MYVFGGGDRYDVVLTSVERYSIIDNTWELLPDMEKGRAGHRAVT